MYCGYSRGHKFNPFLVCIALVVPIQTCSCTCLIVSLHNLRQAFGLRYVTGENWPLAVLKFYSAGPIKMCLLLQ